MLSQHGYGVHPCQAIRVTLDDYLLGRMGALQHRHLSWLQRCGAEEDCERFLETRYPWSLPQYPIRSHEPRLARLRALVLRRTWRLRAPTRNTIRPRADL